jgi:transketolase
MSIIKRLLEISYKHKLSHLGSCLSCIEIIENIYNTKKKEDIFILSNGHAGLALYVILESKYGINAEDLLIKHGIHPCYDKVNKIYCSTGSLGLGVAIASGMALADRSRIVQCLISDGECAEGIVWETLAFKTKEGLNNLKVHVNMNGWSAYSKIDCNYLTKRLEAFCPDIIIHNTSSDVLPFLNGMDAHYYVMSDEDYVNL